LQTCDGVPETVRRTLKKQYAKSKQGKETVQKDIADAEAKEITQVIVENRDKLLPELSFALVEYAFGKRKEGRQVESSGDNLSLIPKKASELKDGESCLLLLGDGAGKEGKEVSESCCLDFFPLLEAELSPLLYLKDKSYHASLNQPHKKKMLDRLMDKIIELQGGRQKEKMDALFDIYVSFRELDLNNLTQVATFQQIVSDRLDTLNTFDSFLGASVGKAAAYIKQTFFKTGYAETMSATRLLVGELLDFVENSSLKKSSYLPS